jgi:hypothetical protein
LITSFGKNGYANLAKAGQPGAPALLDLHRAIYDAIIAVDAEAARAAVLRHHRVMLGPSQDRTGTVRGPVMERASWPQTMAL